MNLYYSSAMLTVFATAALIPLATIPLLASTVRRYGRLRGWPLFAAAGLIASAVALAAFTVFPLPTEADLLCSTGGIESWQWDIGHSVSDVQQIRAAEGTRAALTSFTFLQVMANVALFMPFGFFLHQAARWPGIAVVASSFMVSGLIELSQGTGFFGIYPCPYRRFDVDDIAANTTGALIGVIISAVVGAVFSFTRPPRDPDLNPPGYMRRIIGVGIDLVVGFVVLSGAELAAVVAWDVLFGGDPSRTPASDGLTWAARITAGVVMGLIIPAMRRDKASAGQAVMYIAPVRADAVTTRPPGWAVWVRALVRWVPMIVSPTVAGPLMVMADAACAMVRGDRRSLSDLASGTEVRSIPAIRASHTQGTGTLAP
ncbi:VanZ family protein [Demequina flava]|uniref:VanZ family protein n=1 Tax=Demequina flava TaxID=1095025 RepID=UPI0007867DE6|nr:VanZ family protein [Demequina flava]